MMICKSFYLFRVVFKSRTDDTKLRLSRRACTSGESGLRIRTPRVVFFRHTNLFRMIASNMEHISINRVVMILSGRHLSGSTRSLIYFLSAQRSMRTSA